MESFTNKIREILNEKQLTQKELAQKLFMSYSSFNNKMNRYNSFTLEEFLAICDYLSLSPNELLGYHNDNSVYNKFVLLNQHQRSVVLELINLLLKEQ